MFYRTVDKVTAAADAARTSSRVSVLLFVEECGMERHVNRNMHLD